MSSEVELSRATIYLIGGAALASVLSVGIGSYNSKLLEKIVQNQAVQIANVMGDSLPERFYVINGDTSYIEVDGIKLRDYIRK